ncbi:MAG: hypothetical protein R2714_08550 [Microthrixaceae bacterium]
MERWSVACERAGDAAETTGCAHGAGCGSEGGGLGEGGLGEGGRLGAVLVGGRPSGD